MREASQPHFATISSCSSHHHTTACLDILGIDPCLLQNLQGILSKVGLVAPPSFTLELPPVRVPWLHRWLVRLAPLDVLGHQHSPGDPAGSCSVTCAESASEERSGRAFQGLARWSQGLCHYCGTWCSSCTKPCTHGSTAGYCDQSRAGEDIATAAP